MLRTSALHVLPVLGALCMVAAYGQTAGPSTEPLYVGAAPDARGTRPEDVPTLTFYLAARPTGTAVIVCPGGGYGGLADHEGKPVAEWLNSVGVTAAVLKYRLAPAYKHPVMMHDAARAVRVVRSRAATLGIAATRIGILGFSAGGHLASTAATHFDAGDAGSPDPVERVSSRPDFAVLIYPVITMEETYTHGGSRRNLLGDHPSPELVDLMSNEKQVTPRTPPVFLVHGADDAGVPVENSLMFAAACRKAGVSVELHVYAHGPHGFGLGGADPVLSGWPRLCAEWMRARGLLRDAR